MSTKDLDRFQIIKKLISSHINGTQAARLLCLSVRHIKRLKARVKQQGAQGLIHGNQGRAGNHGLSDNERATIVALLRKYYGDFGPTFAAEKLAERHRIARDAKTIRGIMIDEGLWKPKPARNKQTHRAWRERRSSFGEMIQFDGSYEYWFENREGTGEICLLAAIDDATGKITHAKFAEHEGVFPVFTFWSEYLLAHGKPHSVYLDKFSTYSMNHPLAKENGDTLTQFERACQTLRIELIKANSPQAKGRVERLFGTLQDRLVKELRLAGISDIPAANQFLAATFIPLFNAKFSVAPRSDANVHRPFSAQERKQLPGIFSKHTNRTVLNDFTFSFKNQWYQLIKNQPATVSKKDVVTLEEWLDGTLHVRLKSKYLVCQLLPKRPEKQIAQPWVLAARSLDRKAYRPPANHPWRLRGNASLHARQTAGV